MDDDAADLFISQFECALLRILLGQRIPGRLLDFELHRRWDKFGKFRVTIVNQDCFLCVFDQKQQLDEVLHSRSWMIGGLYWG